MDSILKKYRSLECRSCEEHFGYQSRSDKNEVYCSIGCLEKGGVIGGCSGTGNHGLAESAFGGSAKVVATSVLASKISKELEDLNMGTPSPSSNIISQTAAAIPIPTPTPIEPKRVVAPMEPSKRVVAPMEPPKRVVAPMEPPKRVVEPMEPPKRVVEPMEPPKPMVNDVIAPPVMKSAPEKHLAPNIVANDNEAPIPKIGYKNTISKPPGNRLMRSQDEVDGVRLETSSIKRHMLFELPLSTNLRDGCDVGIIFSWNLTRHLIGSFKDDEHREEMQGALGSRQYEQYKGIPKVGEMVLGKYDAALYRAVVTKLEGDNAYLDFIDYGDSTVNKLGDLKVPDEKLIKTPLYGAIVNLVVEKPVEKATPDFEKSLSMALVVEYCGEPPNKPFEYLALLWLSKRSTLNKFLESKPDESEPI